MGDDSTPKEHKGHKRQFSNSFDNNKNDGPRGDTPAKFRRESFGDRSPFNRGGNNRGFRGGGRGGGRGGFRGNGSPSNFNRGGFRGNRGFNNSRGGFGGNRGFNNSNRGGFRDGNDRQSFNSDKPWQQRNNFQNRDNKKTDFEENDAAIKKNKKVFVDDEQPEQQIENESDVEESGSGSEDSSSEDEMVPQQQNGTTNGAVDETNSSDSEDEEEDSVDSEQPKKTAKNEAMDSSESDEEIEVNNSSKVQKQVESSSNDEMEANGAQDDSDSDSEENDLANARENNENVNKAANASTTNSTSHDANEPNPCKLLISRFPPTLKKVHIQKFFEKYGEVREVSLGIRQYDIFGHIIFETPEAAMRAIEVNGMQYEGHIISVQQPWWENEKPIVEPDRTVCLLHVIYGTFRETLWNLFEPLCGPIEMVLVQRGTAYIQFESPDSKQIALHMKHAVINGKSSKIVSCVESPQRGLKPHGRFVSRGKFGPRGLFGGKPGVRRFDNYSNYTNNTQGKEIKIIKNKSDNSFTIKI